MLYLHYNVVITNERITHNNTFTKTTIDTLMLIYNNKNITQMFIALYKMEFLDDTM